MSHFATLSIVVILIVAAVGDFFIAGANIGTWLRLLGFALITGFAMAAVGFAVHRGYRENETLRKRSDNL